MESILKNNNKLIVFLQSVDDYEMLKSINKEQVYLESQFKTRAKSIIESFIVWGYEYCAVLNPTPTLEESLKRNELAYRYSDGITSTFLGRPVKLQYTPLHELKSRLLHI